MTHFAGIFLTTNLSFFLFLIYTDSRQSPRAPFGRQLDPGGAYSGAGGLRSRYPSRGHRGLLLPPEGEDQTETSGSVFGRWSGDGSVR